MFPLLAMALIYAAGLREPERPATDLLWVFPLGVFAWTLLEYGLHRFVFHKKGIDFHAAGAFIDKRSIRSLHLNVVANREGDFGIRPQGAIDIGRCWNRDSVVSGVGRRLARHHFVL